MVESPTMQRARATLEKIGADVLRRATPEDAPLLAWPLVCGSQVAAKTQAVAFAGGTLRVQAPDDAWRKQLGAFQQQYLATFRRLLGERVQKIEFVVAPKKPAQSA